MFKPIIVLILFVVSGCGGGGGGGGGGSAPAIVTPLPVVWQSFNSSNSSDVASLSTYKNSEYSMNWGLNAIKAAEAYVTLDKNGLTSHGDGVTIGLVETGISYKNDNLAANFISGLSYDQANKDNDVGFGGVNSTEDSGSHGTIVAEIAAGVRGNQGNISGTTETKTTSNVGLYTSTITQITKITNDPVSNGSKTITDSYKNTDGDLVSVNTQISTLNNTTTINTVYNIVSSVDRYVNNSSSYVSSPRIHGVAYDSGIAVQKYMCDGWGAAQPTNCSKTTNSDGSTSKNGSSSNIWVSDGIKYFVNASKNNTAGVGSTIKVINLSLGSAGAAIDYLDAINKALSQDIVVVASTGNSGGTNPAYPAGYAGYKSSSGPTINITNEIAVGSVNSNLNLSKFSNFCGFTRDYCMVAPGEGITFQAGASTGGTSISAPYVSGAAAVIRAAWPQLTAPQTVQILLRTATYLDVAGHTKENIGTISKPIYVNDAAGHGLLNLYEAVQAQGQNLIVSSLALSPTSPSSITFSASGYDVRSSSFASDPIFGDAFISNVVPQLSSAVFFDDYGRDYKANLGNKINSKNTVNFSAQILNNYSHQTIPLNFNFSKSESFSSEINVQYQTYKNPTLARLKMVDRSKEDKVLNNSNGFSFTQNFSKNFKAGFAFNTNQIANISDDNFGFLSVGNISTNPFQSFITNQIAGQANQKSFNQIFLKQSFFDKKFSLSFSNQTSYQNNSLIAKGTRDNEISDFTFTYSPQKKSNFVLSFGNLNEFNNNFLNSQALGAFSSTGNVKTSYFKISATKKLFEGLSFISSFSEGATQANGNATGIFRSYDNIKSRSASVGLVSDKLFNGNFGIVYSQPLRVYSGSAVIDVPTGLDANRNVLRYRANVSLKPMGKEEDIEIFFAKNLNEDSNFKVNFITQKQPGSVRDANTAYSLVGNYALKF